VGRQTGFYYPEVPSLATDVSPERETFIELVDSTCVRLYNASIPAENEAAAANRGVKSARERNMAYYLAWHTAELRALAALGEPPQARELYDAWLENFRQRVAIERSLLVHYERTGAPPSRHSSRDVQARGEANPPGSPAVRAELWFFPTGRSTGSRVKRGKDMSSP
jgi:hypothetical protein